MDPRTFTSRLLAYIDEGAEAANLQSDAVRDEAPDLWDGAVAAFGSWEAGLAHSLVFLRQFYERVEARHAADDGGGTVEDTPRPERVVNPGSWNDLYAVATSGIAFRLDPERLPTAHGPAFQTLDDGPGQEHRLERIYCGGDDGAAVLITAPGNALAVDNRLLAGWSRDASPRLPHMQFSGIERDEPIVAAMSRRALRDADRVYSISVQGQLKASDSKEYKRLSTEAIVALLLRDDDVLATFFAGANDASICVASSHGKALVFDAASVRSQGRRATGVRAIALDPDATVVGAFAVVPNQHMVLVTETGLMKRTPMSAFRPQGRAGGGLQTCRLVGSDHVTAAGGVDPAGDVLMVTDTGRWTRFPAFDVPFGDRASRGESLSGLEPGERVVQIVGLPAGPLSED